MLNQSGDGFSGDIVNVVSPCPNGKFGFDQHSIPVTEKPNPKIRDDPTHRRPIIPTPAVLSLIFLKTPSLTSLNYFDFN